MSMRVESFVMASNCMLLLLAEVGNFAAYQHPNPMECIHVDKIPQKGDLA